MMTSRPFSRSTRTRGRSLLAGRRRRSPRTRPHVGRRLDCGRKALRPRRRARPAAAPRRRASRAPARAPPRRGSPGRCPGRARAAPPARSRSRRRPRRAAPSARHGRRGHRRLREPQVVGERQQPLLRAVVEVALEPAPLGVAGLDDARPRGAQLVELGERLGPQRLVLDGEPGGRSERALELRLVHERGSCSTRARVRSRA